MLNNTNNYKENIILVSIILLAFFLRVYELPNSLLIAETHNVFQGIRLHTLDFFNFSDHISENFFKSLFGSIAGLRHVLSTYISSSIYTWMNIPINDYWLCFFYVSLGVFNIIGVYVIGRRLFNNSIFGIAGALAMAINPGQIASSRTDNAEATVTFFVMLSILLLIYYRDNPNSIRRFLFSASLVFIASMESIIILPLIALYQLILFPCRETKPSIKFVDRLKFLYSKENIIVWTPVVLILLLHYYIYLRIGDSNIGLFGYAKNLSYYAQVSMFNYGVFSNLKQIFLSYDLYYFNPTTLLNSIDKNADYLNPIFLLSSLIAFFILIIRKRGDMDDDIKSLIFLSVGFFYFFLLSIFGIGGGYFYIHDAISILFLTSIWIYLYFTSSQKLEKKIITYYLLLLLSIQALSTFKNVLSRQHLIHPMKSIGYYINEHIDNPSVFILLPCSYGDILSNAEFYLGTQIMEEDVYHGKPRKQFCMGSKSIKETLDIYKLNDFDFYISIQNISQAWKNKDGKAEYRNTYTTPVKHLEYHYVQPRIEKILADGVKRVAIIKNNDITLGEIFSRHNLPFKEMDIKKYDVLWDSKYATIAGIIKTNWSGQSSTWGTLYDSNTGVKTGVK
jgi:hypothetical protein